MNNFLESCFDYLKKGEITEENFKFACSDWDTWQAVKYIIQA